jgi:hypothetical protein
VLFGQGAEGGKIISPTAMMQGEEFFAALQNSSRHAPHNIGSSVCAVACGGDVTAAMVNATLTSGMLTFL